MVVNETERGPWRVQRVGRVDKARKEDRWVGTEVEVEVGVEAELENLASCRDAQEMSEGGKTASSVQICSGI